MTAGTCRDAFVTALLPHWARQGGGRSLSMDTFREKYGEVKAYVRDLEQDLAGATPSRFHRPVRAGAAHRAPRRSRARRYAASAAIARAASSRRSRR